IRDCITRRNFARYPGQLPNPDPYNQVIAARCSQIVAEENIGDVFNDIEILRQDVNSARFFNNRTSAGKPVGAWRWPTGGSAVKEDDLASAPDSAFTLQKKHQL